MSKKQRGRKRAAPKASAAGDLPDPRSMEQMMNDLVRLLEEQNFESMDEANAFLEQLTGQRIPERPPGETPLEQAQDLVYEAWEAPTKKKRMTLARQALKRSPDCADAYVLLAGEADTLEETAALFEQGVEAGERALGPDLFEEATGHFWGLLETRPYMRAREGLAECLWVLGQREATIEHFQDMLRLNPNDNQGVRYHLANCLLAEDRDDELGTLLAQYEEDASAAWAYTRALWRFRRQGDGEEADQALEDALARNPHVPAYLLGRKDFPEDLPDYIGFGDDTEAVDYALTAAERWRSTRGALHWLRAHVPLKP